MTLFAMVAATGFLIAAQINPEPIDQQRAEMYFREAKALCDRDNGRLWGVSLCGPMVFADVRTRTVATSEPAPPGDGTGSIGFSNAPIATPIGCATSSQPRVRMKVNGRCRKRAAYLMLHFAPAPHRQNMYFSATCISRMFVRVVRILPKLGEITVTSGLPQFGWLGKLKASNRNWTA